MGVSELTEFRDGLYGHVRADGRAAVVNTATAGVAVVNATTSGGVGKVCATRIHKMVATIT